MGDRSEAVRRAWKTRKGEMEAAKREKKEREAKEAEEKGAEEKGGGERRHEEVVGAALEKSGAALTRAAERGSFSKVAEKSRKAVGLAKDMSEKANAAGTQQAHEHAAEAHRRAMGELYDAGDKARGKETRAIFHAAAEAHKQAADAHAGAAERAGSEGTAAVEHSSKEAAAAAAGAGDDPAWVGDNERGDDDDLERDIEPDPGDDIEDDTETQTQPKPSTVAMSDWAAARTGTAQVSGVAGGDAAIDAVNKANKAAMRKPYGHPSVTKAAAGKAASRAHYEAQRLSAEADANGDPSFHEEAAKAHASAAAEWRRASRSFSGDAAESMKKAALEADAKAREHREKASRPSREEAPPPVTLVNDDEDDEEFGREYHAGREEDVEELRREDRARAEIARRPFPSASATGGLDAPSTSRSMKEAERLYSSNLQAGEALETRYKQHPEAKRAADKLLDAVTKASGANAAQTLEAHGEAAGAYKQAAEEMDRGAQALDKKDKTAAAALRAAAGRAREAAAHHDALWGGSEADLNEAKAAKAEAEKQNYKPFWEGLGSILGGGGRRRYRRR